MLKRYSALIFYTSLALCFFLFSSALYAQDAPVSSVNTANQSSAPSTHKKDAVLQRAQDESLVRPNSFAIVFYKPTYIMPFYYTGAPYNSLYAGNTPNDESLKHNEIKYQLSFKVPLWHNIFNTHTTFYLGYTQLSYWQAYDHDPFFRETDYEPELFFAHEMNVHLFKGWALNFLNLGADHQSNGFGGTLERSWNRIYMSAIFSNGDFALSFRPWFIIKDPTYKRQNPDMASYLGHGLLVAAYKYKRQTFAIESHNLVESGGSRAGTTLDWSFPISHYLEGYIQYFTGYGQSLIEYNHRTNSVGAGISLSNWV